jgi:hypothetical protein
MFRQNKKHNQENLFGLSNPLPKKMKEELLESEFHKFYEIIFLNIKEEDFRCLYSEIGSCPNSSVNVLVKISNNQNGLFLVNSNLNNFIIYCLS